MKPEPNGPNPTSVGSRQGDRSVPDDDLAAQPVGRVRLPSGDQAHRQSRWISTVSGHGVAPHPTCSVREPAGAHPDGL